MDKEMSDYMAQKADDQIQGGLNTKDELLQKIQALEKQLKEKDKSLKSLNEIIELLYVLDKGKRNEPLHT